MVGPRGFTNTIQEFDLRPGGVWRLIMHGPDGQDYANVSEFQEVEPGRLVVLRHLEPVHAFTMTLQLLPEGKGSRFTWHMRFDSEEEVQRVGSFIQKANEENFDRLQTVLIA